MRQIPLRVRRELSRLVPGTGSLELRLFLDSGKDGLVGVAETIMLLLEHAETIGETGVRCACTPGRDLVLFAQALSETFNNRQVREARALSASRPLAGKDIARFVELFPSDAPAIIAHLVNHPDSSIASVFAEYCLLQHQLETKSPVLDDVVHNFGTMKLLVENMANSIGASA